jgi:hypothetical protein
MPGYIVVSSGCGACTMLKEKYPEIEDGATINGYHIIDTANRSVSELKDLPETVRNVRSVPSVCDDTSCSAGVDAVIAKVFAPHGQTSTSYRALAVPAADKHSIEPILVAWGVALPMMVIISKLFM